MTATETRRRVTAERAAALIKMLIDGPCSRARLSEALDMHPVTVSGWLDAMRAAKLVCLCDWAPDSRGYPTIELFRFAPGVPDAVKLVRTRAEQMRYWRANRKLLGLEAVS